MGVLVISVSMRFWNARILHAWTINKRTMDFSAISDADQCVPTLSVGGIVMKTKMAIGYRPLPVRSKQRWHTGIILFEIL